MPFANPHNLKGTVRDAILDADVFIGVSSENILIAEDIRKMRANPIIFAMANPNPEIDPKFAYEGGAGVVGTGRSDLPNQVNNVLAFPGIFKGALEVRATRITSRMKLAAAYTIADAVGEISRDYIIPSSLDFKIADKVSDAVKAAWLEEVEINRLMEVVNHPL